MPRLAPAAPLRSLNLRFFSVVATWIRAAVISVVQHTFRQVVNIRGFFCHCPKLSTITVDNSTQKKRPSSRAGSGNRIPKNLLSANHFPCLGRCRGRKPPAKVSPLWKNLCRPFHLPWSIPPSGALYADNGGFSPSVSTRPLEPALSGCQPKIFVSAHAPAGNRRPVEAFSPVVPARPGGGTRAAIPPKYLFRYCCK